MRRKSILLVLLFVFYPTTWIYSQSRSISSVKIGIFPYLSTQTLIKKWRPFGDYLEKKSGEKILLVTAPDYKEFIERTDSKKYDFIITASHFALLAIENNSYIPLLGPSAKLYGIFVVKKESPYTKLQDLKGKRIATPDPLAIITIAGIKTLRDNDLIPGENIFLTKLASHNSAVLSVLEGKNDVALCSAKAFRIMRKQITEEMKEIHRTEKIPFPIIILANSLVDKNKIDFFSTIMGDYFSKDPQGIKFVKSAGYQRMITVKKQDLEELRKYLQEIKKQLAN